MRICFALPSKSTEKYIYSHTNDKIRADWLEEHFDTIVYSCINHFTANGYDPLGFKQMMAMLHLSNLGFYDTKGNTLKFRAYLPPRRLPTTIELKYEPYLIVLMDETIYHKKPNDQKS